MEGVFTLVTSFNNSSSFLYENAISGFYQKNAISGNTLYLLLHEILFKKVNDLFGRLLKIMSVK